MPERGGLYVVTGQEFSGGRPTLEVAAACIKGGAGIIQLREKHWPADKLVEVGRELRKITRRAGVLFIINDRVDVAVAVEADGVHIGQQDIPLPLVRKMLAPGMVVGVSAGTPAEARAAERDGASYLGVGPIFLTGTKKDARPPGGLGLLSEIRRATGLPIYAIGGIKLGHTAAVIGAGADGVAVVSAVVGADDITAAARAFVNEILKGKQITQEEPK